MSSIISLRQSKTKSIYTARNEYANRASLQKSGFPELTVSMQTMDTALLLIFSEEELIVVEVLKHIVVFVRKQKENVEELRKRNVLGLFLQKEFFINTDNYIVKRLVLYLVSAIMEDFKLEDFETELTKRVLDLSIRFFLEETDDFAIEYLAVIINKCLSDPQVVRSVLDQEEFLDKFYDTIVTSVNPDIILHSFEALQKILKIQNAKEVVIFANDTGFPIDRVVCEVTSDFDEVCTAALNVLNILIVNTSEYSVFRPEHRCIFALQQFVKLLLRKTEIDALALLDIEVLATALLTERMTRLFFEQNLFEKVVLDLQTRPDKYTDEMKCKMLSIFAECAKYEIYLKRLYTAHITEMFLDCLLEAQDPPSPFILVGLNRLIKLQEAANFIAEAFDRGIVSRLLLITHGENNNIKTREQAAELLENLLTFFFHKTATELFNLSLPTVLGDIFGQGLPKTSIDLLLTLLSLIEIFTQNAEYRASLGASELLITKIDLVLKDTFAHAKLTNNIFRCLCTLIDERPVREVLLQNFLPFSIKRGLKSLSNLVKTSVTNMIMQTTRFPEFIEMYIDAGILETLIMFQKHAHCVPTWGTAIESILSKCPSLKFSIRSNLGFTDTTVGRDFLVSKKKLDDFRVFQNILREECSPLCPILVVNFERPEPDPDTIVRVPATVLSPEDRSKNPDGWCYCRQPGDLLLPKLLKELNERLMDEGLVENPTKVRRCIDFEHVSKRAKIIAEVVAQRMSKDLKDLDLNSGENCATDVVQCHMMALSQDLHCNFIPIGMIESGCQFERAVLFKCLADQVGLPCTLQRSVDTKMLFNEIPLPVDVDRDIHCDSKTMQFMPWRMLRPTHIVDLMYNVGALYPVQSRQAIQYLRLY